MLQVQLEQILDQLTFLRFEMILIAGSLFLLLLGLIVKNNIALRITYCAIIISALFFGASVFEEQVILAGSIKIGALESFIKVLIAVFSIWIVFYSNAKKQTLEFYFLILSLVIGSSFMLSASHLLVLYVSVELTSFSSYLLTNFNFQKRSFEAGLKYLLFGGVSSAIMLYGISILYGLGGSMSFDQMVLSGDDPFLVLGFLALIGGLFFKLSVFPFHIWTPATYQQAPADVVAVLSVVPKIAGFVLLHRVISITGSESINWILPLLVAAGIATIAVGTLGALRQTNIKRLMAYGTITHSGLLIGCMVISGQAGLSAFVWYAFVYAIMNLLLFYVISFFDQKGIIDIDQLSGLGKKETYLGVILVIVIIALIGLPPTVGFTSKFYLFSALWQSFQISGDYYILSLLIVAILSVVLSLFYYLKLPYYYFIHTGKNEVDLKVEWFIKLFATIFAMLLLWFFFSPEILNNIVLNFDAIEW